MKQIGCKPNIFDSNNYLMGDFDLIFEAQKKGKNAVVQTKLFSWGAAM